MKPIAIARWLATKTTTLVFGPPTACTYNPLVYARRSHEAYLEKYAKQGVDAILLGMNPGPWGMAQTGVPFGEVHLVREFLGIVEKVDQPARVHPKRPIEGFACTRSEVSGRRLTGCLQCTIFGGQLLPAGVHGGIGAEPHARQASCRGARTAL